MLVWALAVLHELTPSVWAALLDVIAAAPSDSLDEVLELSHQLCRVGLHELLTLKLAFPHLQSCGMSINPSVSQSVSQPIGRSVSPSIN